MALKGKFKHKNKNKHRDYSKNKNTKPKLKSKSKPNNKGGNSFAFKNKFKGKHDGKKGGGSMKGNNKQRINEENYYDFDDDGEEQEQEQEDDPSQRIGKNVNNNNNNNNHQQGSKKRVQRDEEDNYNEDLKSERDVTSKKVKRVNDSTQKTEEIKNQGILDSIIVKQRNQSKGIQKEITQEKGGSSSSSLTQHQKKLEMKLRGAKFRLLNEELYTKNSSESQKTFGQEPELFHLYHEGFQSQVSQWPQNPVDIFIKYITKLPKSLVIADFGCGEAKIAKSVNNRVFSFDFMALNEFVIPCDMSSVPLEDESIDIAIFCLSLMGTNFIDFLREAYRVLKMGGKLKIAEVRSRFEQEKLPIFLSIIANMGFKFEKTDDQNDVFVLFDYTKGMPTEIQQSKFKGKQDTFTLKPCLYKKR